MTSVCTQIGLPRAQRCGGGTHFCWEIHMSGCLSEMPVRWCTQCGEQRVLEACVQLQTCTLTETTGAYRPFRKDKLGWRWKEFPFCEKQWECRQLCLGMNDEPADSVCVSEGRPPWTMLRWTSVAECLIRNTTPFQTTGKASCSQALLLMGNWTTLICWTDNTVGHKQDRMSWTCRAVRCCLS